MLLRGSKVKFEVSENAWTSLNICTFISNSLSFFFHMLVIILLHFSILNSYLWRLSKLVTNTCKVFCLQLLCAVRWFIACFFVYFNRMKKFLQIE